MLAATVSRRETWPTVGASASRSAAIGGTRVARSAGARLESVATSVPTISGTKIVRGSITSPDEGRSTPIATNSALIPGASAIPSSRPSVEPDHAEQHALAEHAGEHLPARGADRPQQAELTRALRDGDRERVEDDERADEQRDEPEDQQEGLQEAEVARDLLGLRPRLVRAGAHLQRARRQLAAQRGDELLGRHARRARPPRSCRSPACRACAAPRAGSARRRSRRRTSRRPRSA